MATHRGFGGLGHALYEGFSPALGSSSRYEVLGKLASGGMGTVHLARMRGSLGFTKLVAIKTMHPRHATDPAACAMFLDEAQVTAHLRHPNIVGAVDFVAERGELMLVMDYIEGDSLRALQKAAANAAPAANAGERIPVSIACAIARDVLHGLHAAHEARDEHDRSLGIIHRDVSPDNMIVGLDGVARVLDFGVARARCAAVAEGDTAVRGKVVYMAPEQLAGQHDLIDRSVDVYAVGAVLWELLAGRRLFRGGGSPRALHEMIMKQEGVMPPSLAAGGNAAATIPAALDAIVLAMIARDPKKRPRTALDAARAIEAAVSKIASAHEVGAFVKRYARPRPVPSTATAAAAKPRCEFDIPTLTGFSLSPRTGTHSSSSVSVSVSVARPKKKKEEGISTTSVYAAAALLMMIAVTALSVKVHSSRGQGATTAAAAVAQCR
jgi:eukaryotic-like serine/threonine-protein kinase